jgi:CubicO group peptidase (beta-lactamase class C family)
MLRKKALLLIALGAAPVLAQPAAKPTSIEQARGEIREMFATSTAAAHVPGTVVGIVKDGKLVLVESLGVRDPVGDAKPIDPDTRFRIASMSKAFTALAILKLRDEGKLSLDAPAARYVPEMAKWKMPAKDSPQIRVGDLLRHSAGFVEDNPWGDRQQVLSDAAYGALIAKGMDFANAPNSHFEYSNYGFALLGRIITRVSGQRYQDYIRQKIMLPLGMTSTTYDIMTDPPGSRAIGYRWQDEKWLREPDMKDGAFGAMGGVETTARDYAKWIGFLLSAWPASDAPETGPARRASVRELVAWGTPAGGADRPGFGGAPCRVASAYGMGLYSTDDCELGRVIRHTGGYPGYGSAMALMPEAGVGMFTFNSRTYFSNSATVTQALLRLRRAGLVPDRPIPVSTGLASAYAFAKDAWQKAAFEGVPLAMNIPLDQDLDRRRAAIATLKDKLGACDMTSAIVPVSAMEGRFEWTCARGILQGRVQRAPTAQLLLQRLDFTEKPSS